MKTTLNEPKQFSYAGYKIYVGLDVDKKSWSVSIYVNDQEYKHFSQDANVSLLVKYLHTHFPEGTYYCAYEAGFCGFWIYEQLQAAGITCLWQTKKKSTDWKLAKKGC